MSSERLPRPLVFEPVTVLPLISTECEPTDRVSRARTSSPSITVPAVPRGSTRRPLELLKVYYIPSRKHVSPSSIIHSQKQEGGFFCHPVLLVSKDNRSRTAEFYAITSCPPKAIQDLGMFLPLGNKAFGEGPDILKLAFGSDTMPLSSYVNLDQCFAIEWDYLHEMRNNINVRVDPNEREKLNLKITQLEAQQNRYIYKPLPASFCNVGSGTVVMLSNPPGANTRGAPILILSNNYPNFRFLRIKIQADNSTFGLKGPTKYKMDQRYCLKLCKNPEKDTHGKPVLLFETNSPELREPSYAEITKDIKTTTADQLKTWCVPPIKIQKASLVQLGAYMEKLSSDRETTEPQEHHQAMPPALHYTREPTGDGFSQNRQYASGLYTHHQPQSYGILPQIPSRGGTPVSSPSYTTNGSIQRPPPQTPLHALPQRPPLGDIPANVMRSYQRAVNAGKYPQGLRPLANQARYEESILFPQYHLDPNGGYTPTTLPFYPGMLQHGYGNEPSRNAVPSRGPPAFTVAADGTFNYHDPRLSNNSAPRPVEPVQHLGYPQEWWKSYPRPPVYDQYPRNA